MRLQGFRACCTAGILTLILSIPLAAQDGELSTGLHYYAVENLERGEVAQRGKAGSLGTAFSRVILSPETRYRVWILEAATLEVGRVEFETGRNNTQSVLPDVFLRRPPQFDKDHDGLHDIGEFILGTDVRDPDTDGDGVPDGTEVVEGLDPADGLALGVGIRSAASLPGNARDISIEDDLMVVAHETGVSGFNVFTGLNPVVLFAVETEGTALRVATSRRLVAVVTGSDGLVIIDASETSEAAILHEIPMSELGGGSALSVTATQGIAYVGTTMSSVSAVELATGEVLSSIDVAGQIQDLGQRGDLVYAASTSHVHALRLDSGTLVETGVANTSYSGIVRLFVGDDVAYAVFNNGPVTLDLAIPEEPELIASPAILGCCFKDMAIDAAGIGVGLRGTTVGLSNGDVALYDLTDPEVIDALIDNDEDGLADTIGTPGTALAIEIANGFAYVADYDGGLQVVSYRERDTEGQPPTIDLVADFTSPVASGDLVFVRATVTDDVQVRSVDFEVAGNSFTDQVFPFELGFVVPHADSETFTVRARAFDTGGNSTWSRDLIVTLGPDTTQPEALSSIPSGAPIGAFDEFHVVFSEEVDLDTVTADSLSLVEAGADGAFETGDDVPVVFESQFWDPSFMSVRLTAAGTIDPGSYVLNVTTDVQDLGGNTLERAFRSILVVYADTDVDGDGVLDGTLDLDGDGLANAYEEALGLDPEVDDYLGLDSDGDGLEDLDEILLGLDPFSVDTDQDGFEDGEELVEGSSAYDSSWIPIGFAIGPAAVWQQHVAVRFVVDQGSVRNDVPPEASLGEKVPSVISVENETP